MAHRYADLDELIADLLPASKENDDEKEAVGRVLEGVSNFIDKFCRRPAGFFSALAGNAAATARRFRGEGNGFLRLPPYVGTATVEGVQSQQFYAHHENGWLYAVQGAADTVGEIVFADGATFIVSAKWGFAETPAAIREAARQLTLRTWETQRGIFGQLTPSGVVIERAMPPIVEEILLTFRRRQFEIT